MTDINKQRFLAELSKLLTFMYEEDRQTAIAMYDRMFDDAEDEQALIQLLGSPTRQAVTVARAYDAKERKLQVEAQSREEDSMEREALPGFVLAINRIYEQAVPAESNVPPVLENQFSLFEAPSEAVEAPVAEPVKEVEAEEAPAAVSVVLPVETIAPPQEETAAAVSEPAEPVDEPAGSVDEVDAFLRDFTIQDDELIPAEPAAPADAEDAAPPVDSSPLVLPDAEEPEPEAEEAAPVTVRRPKVLLLILYWILAIPLTLIGIVILLIPTLAALALAVSIIAAGSASLIAAFSGFAVLADILVVLGIAIILLALGLLCLWLFVWLIGGAIVGLVRAVIALSRSWCYEEVAA